MRNFEYVCKREAPAIDSALHGTFHGSLHFAANRNLHELREVVHLGFGVRIDRKRTHQECLPSLNGAFPLRLQLEGCDSLTRRSARWHVVCDQRLPSAMAENSDHLLHQLPSSLPLGLLCGPESLCTALAHLDHGANLRDILARGHGHVCEQGGEEHPRLLVRLHAFGVRRARLYRNMYRDSSRPPRTIDACPYRHRPFLPTWMANLHLREILQPAQRCGSR